MKKWHIIKTGVCSLLFICLLLSLIKRDRGPLVEGKPLEEWAQHLLITSEPIKHNTAKNAVAQLGTNAIPWLRKTLNYNDPIWKRPLISLVQSVPLIEVKTIHQWANTYELASIRAGGVAGLAELGDLAAPAIPDLVEALGDSEHLVYNHSLTALNGMGKLPFHEITNRLNKVEGQHLARLLHVLRNMKQDAATAAPILAKIIKNRSGSKEANAAESALSTMGANAAPAAVQLAVSDRYELRLVGFNLLSRLIPTEHELWAELKFGMQLGNKREKEILLALQNVWGNPNEVYNSLSEAIFRGTPLSCEAAIFLMSEAAKPDNTYERKLKKLQDKTLKSNPDVLEAALKKISAFSKKEPEKNTLK